jgi:predicted nuclease with TOPRIM domain
MPKLSSVINSTQDTYDLDLKEVHELTRELRDLRGKVQQYATETDHLISSLEEKFQAFLYDFLKEFLSYLTVLDGLQVKLDQQHSRLRENKDKLHLLNDKISVIEKMDSRNQRLAQWRTKCIAVAATVLVVVLVMYYILQLYYNK